MKFAVCTVIVLLVIVPLGCTVPGTSFLNEMTLRANTNKRDTGAIRADPERLAKPQTPVEPASDPSRGTATLE